jgi:periplasmic protein TonB
MFDKLIESDTTGAEFKNRSRYFMVSTVVVGILFITAVVYSIYATDIGLVNSNFDTAELMAPVETVEPEPRTDPEQPQSSSHKSEIPVRTTNMARPDEFQFVPDRPSSERNSQTSRPLGRYILDPSGTNADGFGSAPTGIPATSRSGSSSTASVADADADEVKSTPPPPVRTKPPVKTTVSEGVINGKATYLPIPAYPPPAKAVGAYGTVHVQVTINEDGKVISARAVSGHPFLRTAAERSAWNAKFSPTYLSRVAVKVTGVIVYNFKQP